MRHEASFFLRGGFVLDAQERRRFFRGVTVPLPECPAGTRIPQNIPAKDAAAFFARLRARGVNLVLWQLAWESVEPDGPEQYDEEFLAQLRLILKDAEEHGISVFIQPVMRGWCRLSGGVGAPLWTLGSVGMDAERLSACSDAAAAFIQSSGLSKSVPNPVHDYVRGTMFSIFFAGESLAPGLCVDGENIQDYLQGRYIAAMRHTARRIKDCKAVVGFSCIRGASCGFIGGGTESGGDVSSAKRPSEAHRHGTSPADAIKAANGFPLSLKKQAGRLPVLRQGGETVFSAAGTVFSDSAECPWKQAQVWRTGDDGEPVFAAPDFFGGISLPDFAEKHMKKMQRDFIAAFQKKHPHYLFLSEPTEEGLRPLWRYADDASGKRSQTIEKEGGVLPAHDVEAAKIIATCAIPRMPRTITGQPAVARYKSLLMAELEGAGKGGVPVIALFPAADKSASASRKSAAQETRAKESLLAAYDVMCELSASCVEEAGTAESALEGEAACRPYVVALNGKAVQGIFAPAPSPVFTLEWDAFPQSAGTDLSHATEIFVPAECFPQGWKVDSFDGVGTLSCQPEQNRLFVTTLTERRCGVKIVAE